MTPQSLGDRTAIVSVFVQQMPTCNLFAIVKFIVNFHYKKRSNTIPTSILSFMSFVKIPSLIRCDSSSSPISISLTRSTRFFLNRSLWSFDIAIVMQFYRTPSRLNNEQQQSNINESALWTHQHHYEELHNWMKWEISADTDDIHNTWP